MEAERKTDGSSGHLQQVKYTVLTISCISFNPLKISIAHNENKLQNMKSLVMQLQPRKNSQNHCHMSANSALGYNYKN